MSSATFWLLIGDTPSGPLNVAEIHGKLANGEIQWQTLACPVGTNNWQPLAATSGIGPNAAAPAGTDVPKPASQQIEPELDVLAVSSLANPPSNAPSSVCPWDPAAILWLGIPFTPMWAGIMAALNERRVSTGKPLWIPLAIGFGFLAVDMVVGWVVDWIWLSATLYIGALVLLWKKVLRHQMDEYQRAKTDQRRQKSRWLWPNIAGAPLALLTLSGYVIVPLLPLEPREVCEHFCNASTVRQMSRYTTTKMLPALETLAKQATSDGPLHFELTDEAIAPPAWGGGFLVGWRMVFTDGGQHVRMEGVFHLVHWSGEWKIEDMYFLSANGQSIEPPFVLSTDYPRLTQSTATKLQRGTANEPNRPNVSGQAANGKVVPWGPDANSRLDTSHSNDKRVESHDTWPLVLLKRFTLGFILIFGGTIAAFFNCPAIASRIKWLNMPISELLRFTLGDWPIDRILGIAIVVTLPFWFLADIAPGWCMNNVAWSQRIAGLTGLVWLVVGIRAVSTGMVPSFTGKPVQGSTFYRVFGLLPILFGAMLLIRALLVRSTGVP